jgi:hypothetical protein
VRLDLGAYPVHRLGRSKVGDDDAAVFSEYVCDFRGR